MNNCYLSGNGHQQQQQHQYQQQKPLSISANNFSPASNTTSSFSDNSKTLYKSHNTGGNCDKNYQQQATQQQQLYGGSSKNDNSASYLSQSTPSTHFDFEHMLNEPNIDSQNHNLSKSHNTTASGSSRSSRHSYQANQATADQFQGSLSERFLSEKFL